MGLDVSHDAWHGAYSAFTRWRNRLAEAAGYEIAKIEGGGPPLILIDWGHIVEKNYYGEWDSTPIDPLILLIAHSDCDGMLTPEHASLVADRLTELLPLLPDEPEAGHIRNMRAKTQQFIDGCLLAAANGEQLEFA